MHGHGIDRHSIYIGIAIDQAMEYIVNRYGLKHSLLVCFSIVKHSICIGILCILLISGDWLWRCIENIVV